MAFLRRSHWLPCALVALLPLSSAAIAGCSGDTVTATTGGVASGAGGEGGSPVGAGGEGGMGGKGSGGDATTGQGGAGGEQAMRGPVSFTTSPPLTGKVAEPFAYTAQATQQGALPGDMIIYSLVNGPAGMTVDPASGEVAWTPAPDQLGMNDVSLTAEGPDGQSAKQDFKVDVAPGAKIISLWPAAGLSKGNEVITIKGEGFQGKVGVFFDDVPAAAVMISDQTTLTVTTPPAVAKTRPVRVTLDGTTQWTFTPGFTHLPSITSTDVASADLASNLKVQGFGFDPGAVDPNALIIAARSGTRRKIVPSSSIGGEAVFTLGVGSSESSLATGAISVEVNGLRSNWLPLGISNAVLPSELAVTSTDGAHPTGSNVVLNGAGFAGLLPTDVSVLFAGSAAPVAASQINAAGTQVTVAIPADAKTGPATITAPGKLPATSHVPISVTGTLAALSVLDTTPAGGLPGSALVVRGTGFATDPAMVSVTFDGVQSKILSTEADRIVVEVPPQGLAFGPAEVLVTSNGSTVNAGIYSLVGPYDIIAGTGIDDVVIGDDGPPALAPAEAGFIATDAANDYYLADRKWIRVINNTPGALSIFGVNVAAGTIKTVVSATETVSAIAVHPVTEDLYFSAGARIYRAKRTDGSIVAYAGTGTPGNGGNGGFRLTAAFSGISDLRFTADGILLIADNSNGTIRAINTTGSAISRWGQSFASDLVWQIAAPGAANPIGLALDAQDSIYFTTFYQVRKVPFDRLAIGAPGYVESVQIAGSGNATTLPEEGCPVVQKDLGVNSGLAIDGLSGNAFVGSRHGLVRRIKAAGGSAPTLLDTDDCIDFYAGSWDAGQAIPNAGYAGDGGPAKSAVMALFSRPFVDRKGNVLVPAEGRVRLIDFDMGGNPGTVKTIAGVGPAPLDNTDALQLRTLNTLGDIVVDAASNRYLYAAAGRVLSHDKATGMVTVVAGTGYLGNQIAAGGAAPQSDIGSLRGIGLGGGQLYLLEATVPRVSVVDLGVVKISVAAGDGRLATVAEQQAAGLATAARVAINTGAPKAVVGPDGALYFADSNILRVLNPTAATITAFGVTLAPGFIDDIPLNFGTNLSGIAFDANGTLYVASYDSNAVWRVPAAGPYVPEALVTGDGQRYGVAVPGVVMNLRLNRPSDLTFLADGSLLIANDFGNTMVMIEADAAGQIGKTSHFSHVFGSGAPGKVMPAVSAAALPATRMGAGAVDGSDVLILGGERVFKMKMP